MTDPFTLRWGILATGGIAKTFSKDLLIDPKTRNVDIRHRVVAAASSTSANRAEEFLRDIGAETSAKAYGSYKELAADPDVDIIYIATPHSHHYQNARLCLEANKNVLVEKAFTTNAQQAEELIKIARSKKVFMMEALWTRYFPLSIYVREIITSGRLGKVHSAHANNFILASTGEKLFDESSRMVNPELAGGALLDLGIYALTWIFQCLYHTLPDSEKTQPQVASIVKKYPLSGVDEMTSMVLSFPRSAKLGGDIHGVAATGMRISNDVDGKGSSGPAVRIRGDKGEIQVMPPAWRPTKTKLILDDGTVEEKDWPQPGPGGDYRQGFGSDVDAPGEGHGMFWEADECAFAIREGRREGRYLDLDESLVIMRTMDEVRRQNGIVYPSKIETTDYPVEL